MNTDLDFDFARSLDDVLEAWHLLYEVYLRAGYICANPYELHTVPQAIGPETLVVLARVGGRVVSTVSVIGDSSRGLPLDSVYPEELSGLRAEDRNLVEVGLFGNHLTAHTLLRLTRYTYYFGLYLGASDFLCGIPPRRTRLYWRVLGFYPVGEVKGYPAVRDNPVRLVRLESTHIKQHYEAHLALNYFVKHPVALDTFDSRFRFALEALVGSPLEGYLKAG